MSPAAAAKTASLTIDIVSTRDGFLALEHDWTALFDRAGRGSQVFQTFAFLRHWADVYLDDALELAIVTGRRDGRLVMVWPLVLSRVAGIKVLSWMGEPVSQYGDVLVEPGADAAADLAAGFEAVRGLGADVLSLRKTRADAVIAPFMADLAPLVTQRLTAPFADLTTTPAGASFDTRFPAKDRKNRRRQMRRLEERGAVAFTTLAPGPDAVAAADTAITMKLQWLATRGIAGSAVADARFARFFAAVAGDAENAAGLYVTTLGSAGETVAVAIGFAAKGHLAMHVIAHAASCDKLGVGALLMEHNMARAHAGGLAVFDLLAPGDAYKSNWAERSIEVCDLALPLTLAGGLYARGWLGTLRPALKRAVTRGGALLRPHRKAA